MPTSLNRAYRYPSQVQEPDAAGDIQRLAEDVDADMKAALDRVAVIEGLEHAEFTGGTVSSPAGAGVSFGLLTADANKTFQNTFCEPGSPNGIKFLKSGSYLVTSNGIPATTAGNIHLWASVSGTAFLSQNHSSYGSTAVTGTFLAYFAAGDVLSLGITTANTVNVTSRVKIAKL